MHALDTHIARRLRGACAGRAAAAAADPIADFYKGKQINWILSAGAGGGYSSYAHVFAPLFQRAHSRASPTSSCRTCRAPAASGR